ncbi:hypothetical protein ELE98_38845 [Klebsiella pneumoniae]|nr:hypothetical protein [Klebsiella pneumoniae]
MIKDYLIVAYLTAIVALPFTLVLIGLSARAALYMRRRVLCVALVVLFMLVVIAAWQFERYM